MKNLHESRAAETRKAEEGKQKNKFETKEEIGK